jgi:hypothetical protein
MQPMAFIAVNAAECQKSIKYRDFNQEVGLNMQCIKLALVRI